MRRSAIPDAIAAFLGALVPSLGVASACTRDAMIVFDGSGSMAETGFNLIDVLRIFDARQAVGRAMPLVAPVRRVGPIIYGPGQAGACSNIDLRVPPMHDAGQMVLDAVDMLQPSGETPLTESVRLAAGVLDYRAEPVMIVLVTDGKETCGGAPCQLAAELAADTHDLTVHVIGFQVRSDFFNWTSGVEAGATTVAECLADRTGGRYVSAETVEELADALQELLGCALLSRIDTRNSSRS